MKRVKDYDENVKSEHYIVKRINTDKCPATTVYDNRSGTDQEYYRIFAEPVKKVVQRKDYFVIYI